ncbi:MAG: nitronate monooxygenase [Ignavibacteriae bacterium]|nr:MAG: nitronate monooxygenase [Ignavibacteriota bacterium]
MGIGISGWRLARAVSTAGQLGVVSGTASDILMTRTLEDGDPGGHLRRALDHFPLRDVAARILREHFNPHGRKHNAPYHSVKLLKFPMTKEREELIMAATFAEVFLAKEGHDGVIGINLLTKVQLPTLASIYGAMLADVDVVVMGAGIPREIPGVLDRFANHEDASIRLDVVGTDAGEFYDLHFDPKHHVDAGHAPLHRPQFLAIISSNSLATMLARKATGRVDGFIVEGPTAGGHNAPPRGEVVLSERGEPVYGPRDAVDLNALASIGLPFWIAGGAGTTEAYRAAIDAGATGIQIGTLMAFCEESGFAPEIRNDVIDAALAGTLQVFTDPLASPTGYPFKLVGLGHAPEPAEPRTRRCDLGYLRTMYKLEDGRISHRCPAEPVKIFTAKGGTAEETTGRRCLCNALLANTGHGQVRKDGTTEPTLITAGDQAEHLGEFLHGRTSYTARDVLDYLQN